MSILAANINKGDGYLLQDLNKALRFSKNISETPIRMTRLVDKLEDLVYVCFSDAAFQVRSDQSSQVATCWWLVPRRSFRAST